MILKKSVPILMCVCATLVLSACSETQYAAHVAKQISLPQDAASKSVGTFKVGNDYNIQGRRYSPTETYNHTEEGMASWYGPGFHGKKTANGEYFDKNELTAAHRTLQLPSIIKVTNLDNGRSAILRVNDRGPFARDRILDVSERAANILGFKNKGIAKIRIELLADASKEVASVARSGASTRGYEVAYNNKQILNAPVPAAKPQPVMVEPMQTARIPAVQAQPYINSAVNTSVGNIANAGRLYVQAGSFSQEVNALNFSNKMSQFGPSRVYLTRVNNQPYYRVRLGPYENSAQAQQVMTSMIQSGNQNVVIVAD